MTLQELGKKWSAARAAKGFTRINVCDTFPGLFMPRDLRAVESGEHVPTQTMLIACAQLYGVRERDLLG